MVLALRVKQFKYEPIYLLEPPRFDVWKVTTDIDGVSIHYAIEDNSPSVFDIYWTKNDEVLKFENTNYVGGSFEDNFLKITSPTVADGGKYCCTITNAVGSASMDVTLGNFQFSLLNLYVNVSIGWYSFRTIKMLFCQSCTVDKGICYIVCLTKIMVMRPSSFSHQLENCEKLG